MASKGFRVRLDDGSEMDLDSDMVRSWHDQGLIRGDTPMRIAVREPTAAELRAAARALRSSNGAYILDSTHYPTPAEWAKRDQP